MPQSPNEFKSVRDVLEELLWGEHDDERADLDEATADIRSLIKELVAEARIDEVNQFEKELVCYDQVLNEKHILNTVISYASDRIAELKGEESV